MSASATTTKDATKDDAVDGTVLFAWGGLSHVPLQSP